MICYLICICIEIFVGKPESALGLIHAGVALHARLVTEKNMPLEEADFILGFLACSRTLCSQYISRAIPDRPAGPTIALDHWLKGIVPRFMNEKRGYMATEQTRRDIVVLIYAAQEPGKVFSPWTIC
ncbi:uncharacterized protein DNG_09270 [Cephalotrichum gorgonifer]|uniref:Uncharacterized protein n=1 Tax=Cephalotrichum gorgonifer TaxID=2041049 RepID=A0AAE8N847_9PEZI|nr:uncharacterized protein DNG_09270 [Cephalotrichum gorgonifer]